MPHYIIHIETGWRSHIYPTREAAQAWIDGYQVTQAYKDANYRIVSVEDYWARRRGRLTALAV